MKISLDWLKDWVDPGFAPADLAHRLTMGGFEVEAIERAAPEFRGVVVAEIVECARHPDADKLSVCRVSAGQGEPVQVVCGAPNARAGLRSALAVVGAELPGSLHIKRARLRGVESHGMLCSARELGLSEGHEGILELPAGLEPGTDLRAALRLDDTLLTLNITPNRGDALSMAGVAREVAAITGCAISQPAIPAVAARIQDTLEVRLLDPVAGPKFVGRVIRGIRPDAVTPFWMQERLRRAGLRPISPTVDVTNYVMLELGQPMHAYDLRQLHERVEVRFARAGEKLTLLDGREVELQPDVLVIADVAGPVALAGVMGGDRSGIAPDTHDVFLEVAFFMPDAVAGRARRFGLQTDASQRFERGVDPTLQERAMERATALLLEIAGGEAGPTVVTTVDGHLPRPRGLWLRPERVAGLLGIELGNAQVIDILERLGMKATDAGKLIEVVAPAFRFDIGIEQDLIEEVARIYGYDAIPEADAAMPQVPAPATERSVSRERAMLTLADRGYQEAITYSFVDGALQQLLFPGVHGLALQNPISADLAVMRVSLWPGLVRALGENARRQQDRVRLFEVGNRFLVDGESLEERMTVAGIAWGRALPEQWGVPSRGIDFYDVKADVEALLDSTGRSVVVRYVPARLPCLHPGRSARIKTTAGQTLGWLGQLHPEISKQLEMKDPPYLFELDYNLSFESQPSVFKEISRYPAIRRDLAVVVDESVPLDAIRESVNVAAEGLLQELRVFDVYRGPGIDSGRKSIALGLILQETSRTLTDADADQMIAAVVARLKADLRAAIRE